jgi:hypothetical protein
MEIRLRDDRVQWLETDGEVVALHNASLSYLGLNETGSVLWQALVAGATREELVARLLDTFDVSRATAESDTGAFLAELERLELIAH